MPVLDLHKRYYCNGGYCYGGVARPWWVAFIIAIPILIMVVLFFLLRRRNASRRRTGDPPVYGTGWTTYGMNVQPQQQYQQPYQQPQNGQGYGPTYNNPAQYYNNQGTGYYGTEPKPQETEAQLPSYQQASQTNTGEGYQRPPTAPPTAPQQAFGRA